MVWRDLGGHGDAERLRTPDLVHRLGGGDVADVQRRGLVAGDQEVARDHHALGDARMPVKAELRRDRALVHLTAPRQGQVLLVQRQLEAGDAAVLERTAPQASSLSPISAIAPSTRRTSSSAPSSPDAWSTSLAPAISTFAPGARRWKSRSSRASTTPPPVRRRRPAEPPGCWWWWAPSGGR